MANIKSSKKRAKTNEIRRKRNVARRSEIKTSTRKFVDAVDSKDIEGARVLLREVEAKIARACGKGLFKKNTASRKISRLAKKLAGASKK